MSKEPLTLDKFSTERYKKDNEDYLQSAADRIRIEKIIENVGTGHSVLDIGCYEGSIGQSMIQNKNKVFGIDVTMIGLSSALKKGVKSVCGDLSHFMPFKNESFDTVVAGEVIEHMVDTDFFLTEIKRVLKPNGRLIITTPNTASLGRRILLFLGKNPHFEASLTFPGNPAGHVRYYTPDLLGAFLKHHGFTIDNFTSNIVNFTGSGSLSSKALAQIFPGMGACLIFIARKQ